MLKTACLVFMGSLAPLLWSTGAHAQSLADCGDIHVEAEAQCEVTGGVMCEAMCTPVSVRAACAAKLTGTCDAQCNASASLDCNASCETQCTGQCNLDPGKFDCTGSCQADCGATCSAHCAADGNSAECKASCEASCGVSCQGKCDVEPPEASCDAKCNASCSGSCEAQANLDCQIDCQGELQADCELDVQGGCEAECTTEQGALFCDGQYVDHGDHLDKCVTAIEAYIDANVDGYAQGQSSCGGGSCEASGEAGVSCSAAPAAPGSSAAWFGALGLGALSMLRRRRRLLPTTRR